jgi:hypothetical protein
MRTLKPKAIALLGAAILSLAACGGSNGSRAGGGGNVQSPGEAGARALLDADLAARRSRDLNKRYGLESPSYRAACSAQHFAMGAGIDWLGVEAEGANWADIDAHDVKITINGDTARIAFIVAAKGRDLFEVAATSSDPYTVVYQQGQWWKYDLRTNDFMGDPC